MTNENSSKPTYLKRSQAGSNESGAALATAILMMALLGAIAMTVLAVVRTETRIAGSDLKRTQTYSARAACAEKMTSDFSQLFTKTARPTDSPFVCGHGSLLRAVTVEGPQFFQTLDVDTAT